MKKKNYEKPAMKVVQFQKQLQLLTGSTGLQNYTVHGYYEE